MDLDAGRVQRDSFDANAHNLHPLKFLEHPVEHASLGPTIHARVNRVPVAEALGHSAPLAAMLSNVQDGIDHLQIAEADIATLNRQAVLDLGELFRRDLHARSLQPLGSQAQ